MSGNSKKIVKFGSGNPINIQTLVQRGGEETIRVQVDYSKVPPPDPYYIADYARIEAMESSILLTLGKLDGYRGARLRNKLEVVLPAYAFLGQWMGSQEFISKVKESREKKGYPSYSRPEVDEATEKVQTVHSNSMFISGADGECCIDLYFLSPRDVRFFMERNDTPHLEPLVRVILDPSLLVNLGDSFSDLAAKMKPYGPTEELDTIAETEEDNEKLELHNS